MSFHIIIIPPSSSVTIQVPSGSLTFQTQVKRHRLIGGSSLSLSGCVRPRRLGQIVVPLCTFHSYYISSPLFGHCGLARATFSPHTSPRALPKKKRYAHFHHAIPQSYRVPHTSISPYATYIEHTRLLVEYTAPRVHNILLYTCPSSSS